MPVEYPFRSFWFGIFISFKYFGITLLSQRSLKKVKLHKKTRFTFETEKGKLKKRDENTNKGKNQKRGVKEKMQKKKAIVNKI